jgi:putative transposase
MCTVPKPFPRGFREDVIRVARNREPGVRIKDVAADFGISESCLQNWLTQADRGDGVRSGPTTGEQAELREAKEADPVARAGERGPAPGRGVPVPGTAAGEMMYPLVRDLAGDGVPVTVSCRVVKISRRPYYRWLDFPVTDAELDEAWLANAIFDAHRDDPEFGFRFLADEVRAAGFEVSDRVVWRICRDMGWWSVFGKPRSARRPNGHTGARRPRAPQVHRRRAQRDLGGGHHRAPHRRGQGLPLRDQGPVLEPDRRLGHRRAHEGPARCRRHRDGRGPPRR